MLHVSFFPNLLILSWISNLFHIFMAKPFTVILTILEYFLFIIYLCVADKPNASGIKTGGKFSRPFY